ncbi:hypothetical protein DPMN_158316 [Dreissena polymorpha]|uniref:Uncharacterized protein n=1 Tax=Dreissena polymorpha TaxID=45954 RepID=A0A9D4IN26_DREPO|nr:hypothetical protein DPMN_158316 [Dreissena polymorpha]
MFLPNTEFASTSTAEYLVGIVLKSADQFLCADPPPLLPSIEIIILCNVTCSYTCLRCLFCTLLTLDHALMFYLQSIYIKCAEAAKREIRAILQKYVNNSSIVETENANPYLLKALHGLNVKSLSLSIMQGGLNVAREESLLQSLSSLTKLETLSIKVDFDSPGLWKALYGLNIKSLSLRGFWEGLCVENVELQSQSLSSLTQLETLSIEVRYDSPSLWKALHGLNIKSLSLSGTWGGLNVYHESLSKSLTSLTQLETVTLYEKTYHQIELPQSLKYLNIYCDGLLPSKVLELVDTLPTCTQKVGSNLKLCCFLEILLVENIPLEKYTVIQQELQTRKNLTVERFQISGRTLETNFVIQCE